MRILFANDAPLGEGDSGREPCSLAVALDAAGHAVRAIDLGPAGTASRRISTRRVICSGNDPQAEIPFDAPRFGATTRDGPRFAELTDEELTTLRQVLRCGARHRDRRLRSADYSLSSHLGAGAFGPESGVPYVLTAQRDELDELARDERYRA